MSHLPFSVPDPNLFTEEDVSALVHNFYAKARKDPDLGPIFESHVIDWDAHFVQMTNFWSAQLRGTSRFRGAPMPKHIILPDLTAELFERWLQLFKQTTEELGNFSVKQLKNWEILLCNTTLIQLLVSSPRVYGKDIK